MKQEGAVDRYLVPGLVRGLAVLKLFTPERPNLRLADIAAALGITRSAAFRTVYTLVETGCLLHDERLRSYALGPGVLRLTYGYVATREIVEIAQPELERLRDRSGWSAHLGVLDGTSVLYVLRAAAREASTSIVHVGSRLPARSTTMGRVLLADLADEEIIERFRADRPGVGRGKGPSLPGLLDQVQGDRGAEVVWHMGDFEAGVLSAAAPVRDLTGRVAAAINLTSARSPRPGAAERAAIADDLLATARQISKLMGHAPAS
jgi:IclR family pca regulon transcriptional regulator